MPFNSGVGGNKVVPFFGGGQVPNPANIQVSASTAPSTNNIDANVGDIYVITSTGTAYMCVGNTGVNGTVTWAILGGASSDVNTINLNAPVAGNYTLAGTANQLTVTQTAGTSTWTIPATFIAPGSIASTTTITAGTGITSTTGNIVASAGNITATLGSISAATSVTAASFVTSSATVGLTLSDTGLVPTGSNANIDLAIAGKGTGGVIQSRGVVGGDLTIENTNTDNTNGASRAGLEVAVGGASSGDPYINFLVSGAGVYTMGIDNSASDNFVLSASAALGTTDIVTVTSVGALTTAAGITSTAGDITASNGDFVASTAAKGPKVVGTTITGATPQINNVRCGQVGFSDVINAAATGALVITNSLITAASVIIFSTSCATAGSACVVRDYVPGAGTVTVNVTNLGGTNTGTTIFVNFWVLN